MDPKEACTKSNCVFEIKIDLTLVGNGTPAQPKLTRPFECNKTTVFRSPFHTPQESLKGMEIETTGFHI